MKPKTSSRRRTHFGRFLLVTFLGGCFSLTTNAYGANAPTACSANSESRQLDYWLGSWAMPNANSGTNTSKVYLSLDKCMFVEHWENGKGHITEKMLAYSPEDKNWYGMFADNEGRVHIFSAGKVASGTAEFDGHSRGPKGEVVLNRLKIVRLAPDSVEESWEKSSDNSATWTTAYRADYVRKNH
jgi:hypothetical protein